MTDKDRLEEIRHNHMICHQGVIKTTTIDLESMEWLIKQVEKVQGLERELKECYKQNEAFSNEHWRQVHDMRIMHEALEKMASRDSNNEPLYDKYELSWIAKQVLEELK